MRRGLLPVLCEHLPVVWIRKHRRVHCCLVEVRHAKLLLPTGMARNEEGSLRQVLHWGRPLLLRDHPHRPRD